MARWRSNSLNNMTIMEIAKEIAQTSGNRFVPVCESTNTREWCVVDTEMQNVVARGLKCSLAENHAKDLSAVHRIGEPAAFSPNDQAETPATKTP